MSAAERNLLGGLMQNPKAFREIKGVVSQDDFENSDMGKIYAGIADMIARGEDVDVVTVSHKMPSWSIKLYNPVHLHEWARAEVYLTAIEEYARVVRIDSVRRQMRDINSLMNSELTKATNPIEVATDITNRLNALREGFSTGDLKSKKLKEILMGETNYDWLIPGLLERQDRLVITGPEGFGKTTLIRQIGILSAAGINPMTFEKIKPVRVLVIDAENTERQWRRAVAGMAAHAAVKGLVDPRETVSIVAGKRIDITKGTHLSEIHHLCDIHNPDMVIVGPLYKLTPKAINNDDDAAPLIVALDSLRDRGIALVMEAHAGKGTSLEGERDLRPRGSAALLGWPEMGMGIMPDKTVPGQARLVKWRGERDQRHWPDIIVRGKNWPFEPSPEYRPFIVPTTDQEMF
jgi:replicative DNA helicase